MVRVPSLPSVQWTVSDRSPESARIPSAGGSAGSASGSAEEEKALSLMVGGVSGSSAAKALPVSAGRSVSMQISRLKYLSGLRCMSVSSACFVLPKSLVFFRFFQEPEQTKDTRCHPGREKHRDIFFFQIVMVVRLQQLSNACAPMLEILSPNVTLSKLLDSRNISFPRLTTLSGIVISVRLLQKEKEPSSMVVTRIGISTLVRPVHPAKAYSPIVVVLSGSVILYNRKYITFCHCNQQ